MRELPASIAVVLLTLRGLMLWLVIPCGFIAWLTHYWWARSASLGQCLGWFDLNLLAFLQRVVMRPVIPDPTANWVPSEKMATVRHRFRPNDLV